MEIFVSALVSSGCVMNNLYPDETECTKFYMCSPYGLQSFKCPSGLHFNPVANYCDWPDIAGCILITSTTSESYDEDIFTMLPQDISTIFSGMGLGSNEDDLQEITNSKERLTTTLTDASSINANNKQTTLSNEHFSSSIYTRYADSSTVTEEDITFSDAQDHVTDINKDYVDFATQYLITEEELFESVHQSESDDNLEELSTNSENFISSHNVYTNSDSEKIVTNEKLFVTKYTIDNDKLDKNLNTDEYIIRTTENYVVSQSNFELQNNATFEFSGTKNPMVNAESTTEFVEQPNVDSFSTHEDIKTTPNYLLNQEGFGDSNTQYLITQQPLINHLIASAVSKSPTIVTSEVESSGPTAKTTELELHTKGQTEDIFNSKLTTTFTPQDTISSFTQEKGGAEGGNAEMANGHDSSISYGTSSEISEKNPVTEQILSAVRNTTDKYFYDSSIEPSVVESAVVETNTKPSDYKETTKFISSETTTTFSESLASYTEMSLNINITASELISSTNENNNEQFSTTQVGFYETDQHEITMEHFLTTNPPTISEYNLDALNTYPEMNSTTEKNYLPKTSSADNNLTDIQYHDKLLTVLNENSVTQKVDKILFFTSSESVTKDSETLSSGISNQDIPILITNTESTKHTTLTVTSPSTDSTSELYFSDGATPYELIGSFSISKSEFVSIPPIESSPVSSEIENAVSNPNKVPITPLKSDTTATDTNKSATETSFDGNFKQQHLDVTATYDSSTDVSSTNELEETTNDNILSVTSNDLVVTEQKTSNANVSEHIPTTELNIHETTFSSNHELDIQTDVERSSKNNIITTSSDLIVTKISLSTEKSTEINEISNDVVDYDLTYNEIDVSDIVSTDSATSSKLNNTENEINIVFTESVTSDSSIQTLNESNDSSLKYNLTSESTGNLSYFIKVIITVTAQNTFPTNSTLNGDDSISNIIEGFIDNGLETIKDFNEVGSNDIFNSYTETTDNVEGNDNDDNDGGDDNEEEDGDDDENDAEDDDDNNVDVNNDSNEKSEDNGNENVHNENGEEHRYYNSHKHRYDADRDHKNKNHEDNIIRNKDEDRYHNNQKHKHRENKFKGVYKLDYNPEPSNGNDNRHNQKDVINNESEKKNIKLIQNRHHESTRRNRENKQENIEVFYKVIGKFKKTVNWF